MKILKYLFLLALLIMLSVMTVNFYVISKSKAFIYSKPGDVPPCYTAIVLGAKVSSAGDLSNFLQDRVDMAIALYQQKKVKRFLLTGDHGRVEYDEVNSMKNYL
jgi:SanA protein